MQVFPGTYRDSLLLLSATRAMEDDTGVDWASAAMATPAAVEDLAAEEAAPLADIEAFPGSETGEPAGAGAELSYG